MADRNVLAPYNGRTNSTNGIALQSQVPPPQASTSAQSSSSSGSLTSPVTPLNPVIQDPALFKRIVEILSTTVNGCIYELGYPVICERLKETERECEELRKVESRLIAENLRLNQALHALRDEQRAANNIGEENANLKRDNSLLRENVPEAFRLLEAKYFYVLDLLKQRHPSVITGAQQGPGMQAVRQIVGVPGSNSQIAPSQPHPPPNNIPTYPGPPPNGMRVSVQPPAHLPQQPEVRLSKSQSVIPAKRPYSGSTSSSAGSSMSTSVGLPPSLSRRMSQPSQPYPPLNVTVPVPAPLPNQSLAHSPRSNSSNTAVAALSPVHNSNHSGPQAPFIAPLSEEERLRRSQSQSHAQWSQPISNPFAGTEVSVAALRALEQRRSRTAEAAPGTARPPAGAEASGQSQRHATGYGYGVGHDSSPAYPVSVDGGKELDIGHFARSITNALRNEAWGRGVRGPPIDTRQQQQQQIASPRQDILEKGVSVSPAQHQAQIVRMSTSSPTSVLSPALAPSSAIAPSPAFAPSPVPPVFPAPPAPSASSAPPASPAPAPSPAFAPGNKRLGTQDTTEVTEKLPRPSPVDLQNSDIPKPGPTISSDGKSASSVSVSAEPPTQAEPEATSASQSAMEVDEVIAVLAEPEPEATPVEPQPEHASETPKDQAPQYSSATPTTPQNAEEEALEDMEISPPQVESSKMQVPLEEHTGLSKEVPISAQAEEDAEEEAEESEEAWGDLTDDEDQSRVGKRSVVDCISSIFYDDDEKDERFCQLCNLRIQALSLTEAPPTFSDSGMRELIAHAKEEHPIAWERLRKSNVEPAA